LKAFRDWFARFDAAAWDQEIDADADNGKLRSLAERALKDHDAGRSTVTSTAGSGRAGTQTAAGRSNRP
jgi:hypothetical protein